MNKSSQCPYLSVIIPVYNEEQRIRSFLESVVSYLLEKEYSYEVIIVDDGSRDATVTITDRSLRETIPDNYEIIQLPRNRGKGGALREGMQHARGDYVFFLDADGSTAINEIDVFIPYLSDDHDIYIAVRTKKHSAPFKRKFFGYGYIYLANMILGTDVKDFTCGFKCYTRHAAREVFSRQTLDNWSFDAENLFVAHKLGFSVKEIPVFWRHVGGSKVKVFKNIIICAIDLFRIKINSSKGIYRTGRPARSRH